ncbi:MAG: radical SAM protein [Deltaproteobacteria bacterium CG07_land_8_20_14_0_80_60_11]|nr:MAG: radical SAM protein [Deltaproteobacteria bacterium CG07_land_8_20_14_0_80_60_11]
MAHLFGPVPSRRLGRSLGVDLIPPKTCPYNCIYCEVGPTTCQTRQRFSYQTEAMISEMADYLKDPGPAPDFITMAGSGEPTLNLGLGRIIREIKAMTDIPVAVLTNGALLYLPEVRRELAAADVVLPSLDAAREETYRAINRPLPELSLESLLEGLMSFRREYRGRIWLEVMLLKGLNDTEDELTLLRRAIQKIAPDKIQINTAVRPVVEAAARPLDAGEMEAAAATLGGPVEVIASFSRADIVGISGRDDDFVEMLSRRPMTAPDLAQALGLPLVQVVARLKRLQDSGRISHNRYHDQEFYRSQETGAA